MSLYDILDIIGDINGDAKFDIVNELASNAAKVNKIKNKLSRGQDPLEVMSEELPLNTILSTIEYEDLKDRLC